MSDVRVLWRPVVALVGGAALVVELYPLAALTATRPLSGHSVAPAWALAVFVYGIQGLIAGGAAGVCVGLILRVRAWVYAVVSALAGMFLLFLSGRVTIISLGRSASPQYALNEVSVVAGALVGVGLLSLIRALPGAFPKRKPTT